MGVQGLGTLTLPYQRKVALKKYAGKVVGVDTGIIMRGLKFGLQEDDPSYLVRGYHFLNAFHKAGICVVLVNDGASPPWKEDEAADRKETRETKRATIQAAQEKLQEKREEQARYSQWRDTRPTAELVQAAEAAAEPGAVPVAEDLFSDEEHRRFQNYDADLFLSEVRTAEATYDTAVRHNIICRRIDYERLSQLAACMNIQSITGELEADYVLGALARQGMLDAAWTKDGDIPCHGVPVILRGNISDADEWAGAVVEEYTTSDILGGLGINLAQLIDLCYLLGNDYCKGGLPGLGPKGALETIKETATFPDMRAIWETHPLRPKPLAEVPIDQASRDALVALVADAELSATTRAVLLAQLATTISPDLELDGQVRGAMLATLGNLPVRAALVKLVAGRDNNRDSSSIIKASLALLLAELAPEPADLEALLADDPTACLLLQRMQTKHEPPVYSEAVKELLARLFLASAAANAAVAVAVVATNNGDDSDDDDKPLVALGPAPEKPKKRRAPAKPRARKLKPGEVEKTPEELAAEAVVKADKLKKTLVRKAEARVTWNKFLAKYEWSKPLAFDQSKDHMYQLTHRDVRPFDSQALVRFFATHDIDFLALAPRKQWVEPALYRASLDPNLAAAGPAAAAAKPDDNSHEALVAMAMAQYAAATTK